MGQKKPIRKILKEQWEQACNAYLVELLNMWGLDGVYGFWNSHIVGTIYHYGDTHNLSMEDIIFCVDNDIEEEEVLAWEDYILDAYEFNFSVPNLQSWHKGCPRCTQEAFERLRSMKRDLEKAVEEEKERVEKSKK